MKNITRKIKLMALTTCLITGILVSMPIRARAAEVVNVTDVTGLNAALVAAQSGGDTIVLSNDIAGSASATLSANVTITIDGNGHTITGASDSSPSALTLDGGSSTVILKNITLKGGSPDNTSNSNGLYVLGSVSVLSEGTVNCKGGGGSTLSYGVYSDSTGTINVTNAAGEITTGTESYGIYNNDSGTVNVGTATGGTATSSAASNSYGVKNHSDGVINVTTSTAGNGNNFSAGAVNDGNGTINVGTATSGAAHSSSGVLNYSTGVINVGTATAGNSTLYSIGAVNDGNGTINVGTATSGTANYSYGVQNSSAGVINVGTATSGAAYCSYGVYNNSTGVINVGTATSGAANYSYCVSNYSTGVINVGTFSGVANNEGGTVNQGISPTQLTLLKGTGWSCVLDHITIASTGSTIVGTLPSVSKYGVKGVWCTDSTKSTAFTGTTVTGTSTLYSSPSVLSNKTLAVTIEGTGTVCNTSDPSWTNGITQYLQGTEVALSAADTETSPFMYWKDSNGRVVSTAKSYTITLVDNLTLTAVFGAKAEGTHLVIFKNGYGEVIESRYVATAAAGTIAFPTNPSIYGYTFTRWDKNSTDIQGTLDDVVVTAYFTKDADTYTVTANGGTVTGGSSPYPLKTLLSVNANLVAGKTFFDWKDSDGDILSYSPTYDFYASSNVALTAEYFTTGLTVEQKAGIAITSITVNSAQNKVTFIADRVVPNGCTILSHGIIITDNSNTGVNTTAFVIGGTGVSNASSITTPTTPSVGKYALVKSNVSANQTWYARGYIFYKDVSGNVFTVYGDIKSKTIQ